MGVIGNVIGEVRYIDLPITAGTNPTVQYTTDRVLDLIGIEVLAAGATATALKVDGATVAGGAISSFAKNVGKVWATEPSNGVPSASTSGTNGTGGKVDTGVGFLNYQSSGTAQPVATALATALASGTPVTEIDVASLPVNLASGSAVTVGKDIFVLSASATAGDTALTVTSKAPTQNYAVGYGVYVSGSGIVDRNGSVPGPGTFTPISAAIPASKVVEVDVTGTVTVLATLPAADGNGNIIEPTGNSQAGFSNLPADSIPFQVKAADTGLDTFAGIVRLVFQTTFSDPNATAKAAGTYPNNGIQKGSAGIY